jgi:hypothetical protein
MQMLCKNCEHNNPDGAFFCEKCFLQLTDDRVLPPYQGLNFEKMAMAVFQLKNYQMSSQEFRDFLTSLQNRLQETLDMVNSFDLPDDIANEMKNELTLGTDGIKLFLEGIAEMLTYKEDCNYTCVDRGLILAREGNQRLNDALKVNFENYWIMEEAVQEFLNTQQNE